MTGHLNVGTNGTTLIDSAVHYVYHTKSEYINSSCLQFCGRS